MRRFALVLLLLPLGPAAARDDPPFVRQSDVIYGRKHGMALTMDVFRPMRNPSGSAVVFVASGGWFSEKRMIRPAWYRRLIRRGHTVFAVTPDDPPTLLIHGDRDSLVPLRQSRRMVKLLEKAGVEARLIVKQGADHSWRGVEKDLDVIADWFVQRLAKKEPAPAGK